jgi:hypothetical protein
MLLAVGWVDTPRVACTSDIDIGIAAHVPLATFTKSVSIRAEGQAQTFR